MSSVDLNKILIFKHFLKYNSESEFQNLCFIFIYIYIYIHNIEKFYVKIYNFM